MISREQVEHIAKLARIELKEEEKNRFSSELSLILGYIDKLNKVDTSGIVPTSQVTGLKNITREDEFPFSDSAYCLEKKNTREKIIAEAPARKGQYFKVPKILE